HPRSLRAPWSVRPGGLRADDDLGRGLETYTSVLARAQSLSWGPRQLVVGTRPLTSPNCLELILHMEDDNIPGARIISQSACPSGVGVSTTGYAFSFSADHRRDRGCESLCSAAGWRTIARSWRDGRPAANDRHCG